jgi:hypothetical protein
MHTHGRIPSEYDPPRLTRRQRMAYWTAWLGVGALLSSLLMRLLR